MKYVAIALFVSTLAACQSPVYCTGSVDPSIVVEVRDSLTGAPAASGATLLVRSARGGEATPGTSWGDLTLQWGEEQAGTFDVTVRKPGYVDWLRDDVQVPRGQCHVVTARLLARLQPAG